MLSASSDLQKRHQTDSEVPSGQSESDFLLLAVIIQLIMKLGVIKAPPPRCRLPSVDY